MGQTAKHFVMFASYRCWWPCRPSSWPGRQWHGVALGWKPLVDTKLPHINAYDIWLSFFFFNGCITWTAQAHEQPVFSGQHIYNALLKGNLQRPHDVPWKLGTARYISSSHCGPPATEPKDKFREMYFIPNIQNNPIALLTHTSWALDI